MIDITKQAKTYLRVVSVFEALKGFLALIAGWGLLSLLHQDLHALATSLLQSLHLNPAKHYSKLFIKTVDHVSSSNLWMLAALATVYAVIRFSEAYGLWLQRRWAEWLGIISGGIYIPFELYELIQKLSRLRVGVLIINLVIIAYLALDLYQRKKQRSKLIT